MAKKRKTNRPAPQAEEHVQPDKKIIYGNIMRVLCLIAVTMVIFCLYRFLINRYYFEFVLIAYMSVAAIVTFAYVIYNRGFSRRGLTPEMLPDTMSEEEKQQFIADGTNRLRKSRPLLMLVFAFAFTFIWDIIELIAVPFIKGLFGQ